MTKERLQRIEDKVDDMGQAILALARMEEKVITIFKRLDNMEDSFKKFDERMDEAEKQAIARGQKIAFAERFFWMICTGAVGLAFIYLR
jgi:phage shock protein A